MKIDYHSLNAFLTNYPIRRDFCEHDFRNDFEQIGDLYDDSLGFLSYLSFHGTNSEEIFIGAYPLNAAKLHRCKNCGRLTFSHLNDGGFAPKVELIGVDFEKIYVSEPATKSVSIKRERLNDLVETFGFEQLYEPNSIRWNNAPFMIEKDKTYLFNYRDFSTQKGESISFDMIAERKLLRKIADFEKYH